MTDWRNLTKNTFISLDECDLDDTTYFIPCYADLRPVRDSISAQGIINKPLLQKTKEGKYVPVLGRRRLLAARQIGLRGIEARVLEDDVSERMLYEVAFWDNKSHREFEVCTKAVVVHRLLELFSREEVADRFLPALGIPPYGPRIEALCRIATLERDIHALMASGRLNEKTALLLSYLTRDDRRDIITLIDRLKPNINKAAEIISGVLDLATHRGCSVQDILSIPQIREPLTDPKTSDLTALTDTVRKALRRLRYPDLYNEEVRFFEWLRKQRLPVNVTVRPTQAYEDKSCTIEIKVESREQAAALVKKIMTIKGGDLSPRL